MSKKLIPKCQTAWTPLVRQEEFPQHITIPETDHGTITQGKKVNPIIRGINNYFGELKYVINNGEIPTGKYTIPAAILAAYSLPSLSNAVVSNPIGSAKVLGKSLLGGISTNVALKTTTGKDWGQHVHDLTGLDEDVADYTNIGYVLGPSIFNVGKNIAKQIFNGGKNVVKKLITKPKAWEILPDGTEVRVPITKTSPEPIQEIVKVSDTPIQITEPLQITHQAPLYEVVEAPTREVVIDQKSLLDFAKNGRPQSLLLSRLESGGYEKLGIRDYHTIYIPNTHRFATYPSLKPFSSPGRYYVGVDAKKFINKIFNAKPNITKHQSNYTPTMQDIYVDPDVWLENVSPEALAIIDNNPDLLDNFKNMTKTHELFHLAHLARRIYPKPPYDKAAWDTSVNDMVKNHEKFPGVNYDKLTEEMRNYFTHAYGTEMMARFSQLRDWFGIRDSSQPLTLKQWNHAKKHYPYDNNMDYFFNAVEDPKTFIDYMNKIVPVVGTLPLLNVNKDE